MIMRYLTMLVMAVLSINAAMVRADVGESCINSECHANMGTKAFVHGPVGAGICDVCHVPVSDKDHEFTFFASKEELCLGCHETSRDMMLQQYVHSPVLNGDCTGCHDPHQSDFQYTLKGNAADLCYNCHNQEPFNHEFVHGPVGGGDCNVCHNPHASANENQLIQPPDQVCFLCHERMREKTQLRHVHQPVTEKCTNCHDPHSNVSRFMLNSIEPALCIECHGEFDLANDVEHHPVANGECDVCHDVHATNYPRMLLAPLNDLCFSCHEDLGRHVVASKYKHGPIMDGDCNACHNPHGSAFYRLLRKNFPHEFYLPYDTDSYAMCFECHNKSIALDPKTTTLTDFRDDNVNLHYLHVNKDVKGRSCKACHQAHATNQQKHIRKSVPYGSVNWELPVEFTKLEDGGSCIVGCHAPKEYHRK